MWETALKAFKLVIRRVFIALKVVNFCVGLLVLAILVDEVLENLHQIQYRLHIIPILLLAPLLALLKELVFH